MKTVRVVLAVSPQLLSDAVRRTLDLDGIATTDAVVLPQQADVAIVTAGREAEVRARTVITLTGDGDGLAVGTGDPLAIVVSDLGELRSALTGLLPRSGD